MPSTKSPPSTRAVSPGTALVNAPSTRVRPPTSIPLKRGGIEDEASTASATLPVRKTTSSPLFASVAIAAKGRRREAKSLSSSIPSRTERTGAGEPAAKTDKAIPFQSRRRSNSEISFAEYPFAYSAPTMLPIEVPATAPKRIPASSKAASAPTCAIPFAPPLPSASAAHFFFKNMLNSSQTRAPRKCPRHCRAPRG